LIELAFNTALISTTLGLQGESGRPLCEPGCAGTEYADETMVSFPDSSALGPALRRWRILNRVKQSTVADDLGVSQSTVSRWETLALTPEPWQARRLTSILTARPDAASDRALIALVRSSSIPMHLICDFTHRLIAASEGRLATWRVGIDDLLDTSLWRFASRGILAGETGLAAQGWYEPIAPDVTIVSERVSFSELTIPAGLIQYTRMPLADGGFARLVRPGSGRA